jgi:hypothetical protein
MELSIACSSLTTYYQASLLNTPDRTQLQPLIEEVTDEM